MPPAALLLALAVLATADPIAVRTNSNCPAAEAIAQHLQPLLPSGKGPEGSPDTATIEVLRVRSDGFSDLRLRLTKADGTLVGDRAFSLPSRCPELAETVASILAAWELQPPGVAAPPPRIAIPAPAISAPPRDPWQLELGLLGGSASAGGTALRGAFELAFGLRHARLRYRFTLSTETARHADLSPGQVDWRYHALAASLAFQTRTDFVWLAVDAGPLLGVASVQGSGFQANHRDDSIDLGANAGIRLGLGHGRLIPFIETRTHLWARGQRVYLTGNPQTLDLPRAELLFGLGLAGRLFP